MCPLPLLYSNGVLLTDIVLFSQLVVELATPVVVFRYNGPPSSTQGMFPFTVKIVGHAFSYGSNNYTQKQHLQLVSANYSCRNCSHALLIHMKFEYMCNAMAVMFYDIITTLSLLSDKLENDSSEKATSSGSKPDINKYYDSLNVWVSKKIFYFFSKWLTNVIPVNSNIIIASSSINHLYFCQSQCLITITHPKMCLHIIIILVALYY